MLPKKRILVGAIGATVALTLQTPVSAFIAKARGRVPVATAASHHPPSYLADAFTEPGARLLGSDRWKGWRAEVSSSLSDDFDGAAAGRGAEVGSTLGDVDLGYLHAASASEGRNGSIDPASGDNPSAHASYVGGGGGGEGGSAAGAGGAGGGGGGGGAGYPGDGLAASGAAGFGSSQDGLAATGAGLGPYAGGNAGSVFHVVPGPVVIIDPASGGTVGPVNVESPEPGTLLFLGAGLAGLAARRARRNRTGRGRPAI